MTKRRMSISSTAFNVRESADDDYAFNANLFLAYCTAKDLAARTLIYYETQLDYFRRYLDRRGAATRLGRLTASLIESEFIRPRLTEDGVEYVTVASVLRAVRAFLNWALKKGIITETPFDSIEIRKPKSTEIETFSNEQLRTILAQPNPETFVGVRDYTMMVLMLETGVRLKELTEIKTSDIRWEDSQILIHGKNGDDRLVPFQRKCRRVLRAYLNVRRDSASPHLFITYEDDQISRKNVQERIAKYGRMALINNIRCSPHTFRHTFAKLYVVNNGDIFTLQKILGHKTLDMVRVYVNMFSGEVSNAHKKASPIENLL